MHPSQTLLKFLNWIPLGYIFETTLVRTLVYTFLPQPSFRNDVLACLTEIGALDIGAIYENLTGELAAAYDSHFEALFREVATAICIGVGGSPPPMVMPDMDMAQVTPTPSPRPRPCSPCPPAPRPAAVPPRRRAARRRAAAPRSATGVPQRLDPGRGVHPEHCPLLHMLLPAALARRREGGREQPRPAAGVDELAHQHLGRRGPGGASARTHALRLCAAAPTPVASLCCAQLFKICLEYWNLLTSDLYHTECQFQPPPQSALVLSPAALSPASPRRQLYAQILSSLRVLLVTRMAKPEEVLVVESDDGEIIRETMKDSDAITMYKTMRETLVYLTHLSYDDTENIMLEKLQCAQPHRSPRHMAARPRPARCALLGPGPHRLLRAARAGTRWTDRSGRGIT